MGTRRSDGVQVGTYTWKTGGTDWDAFVDGGKNSPYVTIAGNSPAHPTRPYYLTSSEVAGQVVWGTDHGTIETTDAPGAAALHDEAHFETAVVAIDAGGGHSDKVLQAFKWGGPEREPSPTSQRGPRSPARTRASWSDRRSPRVQEYRQARLPRLQRRLSNGCPMTRPARTPCRGGR